MKRLFDVRHKETGQTASVFGVNLNDYGGDFLVWTSGGWDLRPVPEFEPLEGVARLVLGPEAQGPDAFQTEVGAWGDEVFPTSNERSVLAHLRTEVVAELHEGCEPEELADVGLLLLQLAHKRGLCLRGLMREKFERNKRRRWGPPNEHGYQEHVEERT